MSRSRQFSFELPAYTRYLKMILFFFFLLTTNILLHHLYTAIYCSILQFNSAERVKDNTLYKLVQFIRLYPTFPGSRFSVCNFDKI